MTIISDKGQMSHERDFQFWEEVKISYSHQVKVTDNSGQFALRLISRLPYTSYEMSHLKERVSGFVKLLSRVPSSLPKEQAERLKQVLIHINVLNNQVFDRHQLDDVPELKMFFSEVINEHELREDTQFLMNSTLKCASHLGIDKDNGRLLLRWIPIIGYTDYEKKELRRRLLNVVSRLPGIYDEKNIRFLIKNLLVIDRDIFHPECIAQNEGLIYFLSPKILGTAKFNLVVRDTCAFLLMGNVPEETDGCSGCIILQNPKGEKVAVYKPLSQENMSESNRRYAQKIKRLGAGVAKGFGKGSILDTTGGQAYLAEVTAFEVSKLIRPGLVSETHKVELIIHEEVEVGAFQLFVKGKILDIMQLFCFSGQCFERGESTFDDVEMLAMLPQELFEDFALIKWVMGDCDTHGENGLVVLEETPDGHYHFDENDVLFYKNSDGSQRELGEHPQLRKLFPGDETFEVKNLVAIDASWGNAPKHPELQAEQEKFLLAAAKLPHGELPFTKRVDRIQELLAKQDELDRWMIGFYAENGQDPLLTQERIKRRRERLKVLDIFVRTNRPIKDLFSMNSESVIEKLIVEDACKSLEK
jgi:hypothetical protein